MDNTYPICVDYNNPEDALTHAFNEGTFVLQNSPLQSTTVARVFQQLDQFYTQDDAAKLTCSIPEKKPGASRGYIPIGAESGAANVLEKKESYAFGWPEADIPGAIRDNIALCAPNIFPENSVIQEADITGLIKSLADIAQTLATTISKRFNNKALPIDATSNYQCLLRSFRYHPLEALDSALTTGNTLHTDWNFLTMVLTDGPGFQYRRNNGEFQNVTPQCATDMVVNFGDFLSAWSDGKIVSPWHQVLPSTNRVRNSLVFFFYPATEHPPLSDVIYHQGQPLSLFVDQSQPGQHLWALDKLANMNEVYAKKWQQVSRA